MPFVALEQRNLSWKGFVELFSREKKDSSENPTDRSFQVNPPYMTPVLKKRNTDEGHYQRWSTRWAVPGQSKKSYNFNSS